VKETGTLRLPELIAHRGYAARYPENTLIGIEAAIQAGARYVEVDVQLSADSAPVLFHDRDLKRVCGVQGGVHEFTLEQLRQFHAYEFGRFGYKFANTPIATLAELCELLQRHPRVTAFIEVKQESLDHFGIALTLKHIASELRPIAQQCVLISFSNELLLTARNAQQKGWHALGAVVEKWRERKREIIHAIKPEYLFCDVRGLPWFGRLHLEGAQLAVYEVTDAELALRLAERGVALIETFAIGEMLAQLELMRGAAA